MTSRSSGAAKSKERRLYELEEALLAAAKGPRIVLSLTEIRKKGLVAALREWKRKE